jgi:hypothetical protein
MPSTLDARSTPSAPAPHGKTIRVTREHDALIRVTVNGSVTDDDFKEYLVESDRIVARGKAYVLIYDVVAGLEVSPVQRSQQSDWINRNRTNLRQLCRGAVFAMPSPVMRGVLTAVLWVSPLPFETKTVSTVTEAERWASERLRQAGLLGA